VAALTRLPADGTLPAMPQPVDGATYAAKISREEAEMDWRLSSTALDRRIRALDPAPGAFARLDGTVVKLAGPIVGEDGPAVQPGALLPARGALRVACGPDGRGRLAIGRLKPAGSRWMDASAFLAGRALADGARFALPGEG